MHRAPGGLTGLLLAALLIAGCAAQSPPRPPAAAALPVLSRDDLRWLQRTAFGLDSASVAALRRLGRERFLDTQLRERAAPLPAPIAAQIAGLEVSRLDAQQALANTHAARRALNGLADEAAREAARKALNETGNRLGQEAIRRELLREIYSPAQLQERMVAFWLNHFSVYQYKADLRWLSGDYAEHAIRPHALGKFRDLVLATLEHPAMLEYLDNRQNAAGHGNENYARELLELHTLGIGGGYSQQDVQQLARVLTGVGINTDAAPKLRREWQAQYVRRGAFEFNPARHDFGDKTLLGTTIHGSGFDEVETAVTLIVRQPACARFIATRLARAFVADDPKPALVARAARTFLDTDGDIAAVMRTLLLDPEPGPEMTPKFKDPLYFVVSAVRFAYDGRPISNVRPLVNWLGSLGEAPFGHPTPDGYGQTEANWASSGQMSRRFEIARALGSGNAGLFDPEGAGTATTGGFPQLSNRLYFEALEPFLSAGTRTVLAAAASPQEWNWLLLSAPEFNYE